MEIKFKIIVLILGILFTGLTAGLCFTWSNAITPGIGRLDDFGFLRSFQAMNRAIINPSFLIVFFSPVLILSLNTYLFRSDNVSFWLFLTATILFLGGAFLVTILGNVPLNEILDKMDLEILSKSEIQEFRNKFEQPWKRWHFIRTITSFSSFTLLLIGLIYTK